MIKRQLIMQPRPASPCPCPCPPPQIDRSPKHFPSILAYLRDGYVPLPEARRELLELQVGKAKCAALSGRCQLPTACVGRAHQLCGWPCPAIPPSCPAPAPQRPFPSPAAQQAEAKYFALAELAELLEEVIQEEEKEQAAVQVALFVNRGRWLG